MQGFGDTLSRLRTVDLVAPPPPFSLLGGSCDDFFYGRITEESLCAFSFSSLTCKHIDCGSCSCHTCMVSMRFCSIKTLCDFCFIFARVFGSMLGWQAMACLRTVIGHYDLAGGQLLLCILYTMCDMRLLCCGTSHH